MSSLNLSLKNPTPKRLKSIAIIEDNTMERRMLVDFFSKFPNLKIKEFVNGDTCIKDMVVSNATPDLILLDFFLDSDGGNSKDGLEVLSKLKELSPHSEIIMFTSVENERIFELAKKKGAMGYVVKGHDGYEKLDSILANHFTTEDPPPADF